MQESVKLPLFSSLRHPSAVEAAYDGSGLGSGMVLITQNKDLYLVLVLRTSTNGVRRGVHCLL